MIGQATGLDSQVLVLNKTWMPVRVTDARRTFSLLFRDVAEVIRVDDESYVAHDFSDWADLCRQTQRAGQKRGDWSPAATPQGSETYDDPGTALPHRTYDWVRTITELIAVPKVIRLRRYDRLPRHDVKLNRRNIFARDRHRCQYCGDHYPTSQLSVDHILPRSRGGGSSWENLVCCCLRCNTRKGGRTPSEARMRLISKPHKPRRHPMIAHRLDTEKYSSWRPFLTDAHWPVSLG